MTDRARRGFCGRGFGSLLGAGVLRVAVAGVPLALLGACASLPRPVSPGMTLSGRMAVRVEGDAARSFSASFDLAGTEAEGHLTLTSPVGLMIAQAQWGPRGAVLRSSDGEREFPDLDALSAEAFGEPLPLAALMSWLQGRAWPGAPADPPGAGVSAFTQLGWQVDLARQAEGVTVAIRPGVPAVTLRVIAEPA
jgi:outer membrane lipoprotein LolB